MKDTFTCNNTQCFLFMLHFARRVALIRYCDVTAYSETCIITVVYRGYSPNAHKRIQQSLDAAFTAYSLAEREA